MRLFLSLILVTASVLIPSIPAKAETKSQNLFLVYLKDHYGYINPSGKIMLELSTDIKDARNFSEGLAAIYNEKDKALYYINEEGAIVNTPTTTTIFDFSEGMARIVNNSNKWGFTNQDQTKTIPFDFDSAQYFSEGLALVSKSAEYFYIDQKGTPVIGPFIFDEMGHFSNGMAMIKKDNQYGYINKIGQIVVSPQYQDARPFSEGLASVKKNHRYGFINTLGNLIINHQFIMAFDFHEGLAAVIKDGKWGYIQHDGTFAIPPQFRNAEDFSEGYAAVIMDNDHWGYINTSGKTMIEPTYDLYAGKFSGGLAEVINYNGADRFLGYINKQGEIIFENKDQ